MNRLYLYRSLLIQSFIQLPGNNCCVRHFIYPYCSNSHMIPVVPLENECNVQYLMQNNGLVKSNGNGYNIAREKFDNYVYISNFKIFT